VGWGDQGRQAPLVLQQVPLEYEKNVNEVGVVCCLFYFIHNKILIVSYVHTQILALLTARA